MAILRRSPYLSPRSYSVVSRITEIMDTSGVNKRDGVPLALTRSIKDPIHDFITFPAHIWAFIDTRQFQRLRQIKQLGVSYYVWAGASHNRFEHCIGVAHLAGTLVEKLRRDQPELGITDRDVRCVQLAGLCHDLGHGPWSHVWDGVFIPAVLPDQAWTHEDASEMMFDDLIYRNNIPIDQEDINFIKDLIKGTVHHCAGKNPPEKRFLFDIIANKRNGIDVDKFDYIARDVRAIGDHNNFSARRLIDSARVINDELCYHIKDANSVYELCSLRFSNHKRIYSHKTARAIEHMIVDALKAAEPTMKIARHILDPTKYVYLTDNVLERIEMSDNPALEKSRKVIDRIRRRDLYRRVDENMYPYNMYSTLKEGVTPERIVSAAKTLFGSAKSGFVLTPDHVIVDLATLHYGMKERNPLETVKFYGKHNIYDAFIAQPGELSTLMPASFAEIQLRVYTKDPNYWGLIQAGYREVISTLGDATTPPYPNLAGSPSPPAEAPSLNKFTKVDPSFAPPSPSSSAKKKGSSVPPDLLASRSTETQKAHQATGSLDETKSAGSAKAVRALVVRDSLASIATEDPSEAGSTNSARTLVPSQVRDSNAKNEQANLGRGPRTLSKGKTTTTQRLFSPSFSVDLGEPRSEPTKQASSSNSGAMLDEMDAADLDSEAIATETDTHEHPELRASLPRKSSSGAARRRRTNDTEGEASTSRTRLKRQKS